MDKERIYVDAGVDWYQVLLMACKIHLGLEGLRRLQAEAMEEQNEICISTPR